MCSSDLFYRTEQEKEQRNELEVLKEKHQSRLSGSDKTGSVQILGTGGLLVNMARCCNPMPGDEITGYITRGRGVTVHRSDCINVQAVTDPERLVDVSWGNLDEERRFTVPIEIVAYDREGLMRDISTIIADERVNIADVDVKRRQEIATLYITMEITSPKQLTRILSKIEQLNSVVETYRRRTS